MHQRIPSSRDNVSDSFRSNATCWRIYEKTLNYLTRRRARWIAIVALAIAISQTEIVGAYDEKLTTFTATTRVKQFLVCERRADVKIEHPFLIGSY